MLQFVAAIIIPASFLKTELQCAELI